MEQEYIYTNNNNNYNNKKELQKVKYFLKFTSFTNVF